MDEAEAREEQRRLAATVELGPPLAVPKTVCGVDVSYHRSSERAVAAAVILDTETLELVEQVTVTGVTDFPYIPGLLSFRELPLVLEALDRLSSAPELIIADGHGYAHPVRLGMASHLGVISGVPTVGCAKTAFVGEHGELGIERGEWSEIIDGGEIVGHALRTRSRVKPVFVSPGHLIDFASARQVVLAVTRKFRLPETTRLADRISRRALDQIGGQ